MDVSQNFEFDTWYAVTVSFTFWCLIYVFNRKIFNTRSPEFSSRVLAVLHGLITTFLGVNQCFKESIHYDPKEHMSSEQAFILAGSLGYFLVDLIWCLYYQTETNLMIAHHFYSCFALSRMLYKGFDGSSAACGLGALELTNPLLQARWFTRSLGYQETPLFTFLEVIFMVTFFIVRILFGSFYVLNITFQPGRSWEFKFLTLLIYVLSWMFMINILKYFNNKYLKENVEVELANINTS